MDTFNTELINWYNKSRRKLPWRETADPYKIWISEIILQQTRVKQGLDYYHRFIDRYPDIVSLAESSLDEVLLLWQGLGYYSRARNLHHASQQIVNDHGGKFPDNYRDILSLKGVGEYTASAIASFAFNLKHPVIDGNVIRFISRLLGIQHAVNTSESKKEIKSFLDKNITVADPGTFNQALMEFGALQCIPQNPECFKCPFINDCKAYELKMVNELPKKKYKTKVRERYFNYLVLINRSDEPPGVFINARKGEDIWKGLHQFILFESDHVYTGKEMRKVMEENNLRSVDDFISEMIIHKLSHRNINARFFIHLVEGEIEVPGYFSTKLADLINYAFPRLISKFLKDYEKELKKFVK